MNSRGRTLGKTALYALLAAALAGGASADPNRSCTGLVVKDASGKANGNGDGGPGFSAAEVLDLSFRIVFPAGLTLSGDDVLTIDVQTPNGHAYQKLDVPVAELESAENERNLQGYPYPVKVQKLSTATENGRKVRIVEINFPVGGTAITDNGLYGRWTVTAQLPSGSACEGKFTLGP